MEDKIVRIISEISGNDERGIKKSHNLIEDLGFDNLDTIELLMALEDEFNVEIIDDEFETKVLTVEDVITYMKDLLKEE